MHLPKAPAAYDRSDQDQLRGALERADRRSMKLGTALDGIMLKDSGTGTIVMLTVVNGAVVIT